MTATSTDTYDLVGIREDLINNIFNVSPSKTPFVSGAPKVNAKQTLHEWQTDSYAAAADNAAIEGADASFAPETATVRMSNRTQILEKTAMISGTTESTDRAGRDREMTYQMLKKGIEIKTDYERACIGTNNATVAGNATTAREMGSYLVYVTTNTDIAGTGADAANALTDGAAARTDGTQRTFTETMLETVIDSIFANSGEMADTILTNSTQKRVINGFTGRATTTDHRANEGSIVSAADVYKSDYGDLHIIPDVFMRQREVLVYKKDKWAAVTLRAMKSKDIATTGDAEKKQIIMEASLEARNEGSSGGVFDLS